MRIFALGLVVLATACANEIQFPGEGAGGDGGDATSGGSSQGGSAQSGGSQGVGGANASTGATSTSGTGGSTGTAVSAIAVGSGSTGMSASATTGGGGAFPCKTCGDALLGGSPDPFCPGEEPLFFDVISCACQQFCPMECQQACTGTPGPGDCDGCVVSMCGSQLDACLEGSG